MKEEIRKAVMAIMQDKLPVMPQWCKVKSINGFYCDVILDDDDELVVPNILLGYDKSGVVVKPTVDKMVFVVFVSKTTGIVVMAEQSEDIELMGNEFGGLPKIEALVEKINNIEDLLNDLASKYNSHTHPIPTLVTACGSGAGTTTPSNTSTTATTESTVITPTQVSDIENEKVKHGNGQ